MSTVMDIPSRVHGVPRFHIASQAERCVEWLRINGFDVLRVESGQRITIRTCALCDQLEGAVEAYSRTRGGASRYKMVTRWDCLVCWEVEPSEHHQPANPFIVALLRLTGARGEA